MPAIPEAVRRQALHFMSLAPVPPDWTKVVGDYCLVTLHPLPFAQVIEPRPDLAESDVDAAIAEARALVRAHGADVLAWQTGPDLPWLGPSLAQRGLRNEDTPGFESIENAMCLLAPPTPPEDAHADGVEVVAVTTFEQFAAGQRVQNVCFGVSEADQVAAEAAFPERWAEIGHPDNRLLSWNALLDGEVVATAFAVFLDDGLNLNGGAVVEAARGRGAYRALVQIRWEEAVRRGTPALTVQAGRMSAPILARLGFIHLAAMPMYVDQLAS